MGVATYRILDNLEYQQALQYEPARYNRSTGTCDRDNVIVISTQEPTKDANGNEVPVDNNEIVNEPLQQDATYCAVNFSFLPDDKKLTFNMDTSDGKALM